MRTPRRDHAAVLLGDGRVLLVGGETANGTPLADVELYEPLSGEWVEASPLLTPRSRAAAVLLPDGRVLVSGGLGLQKDGSVAPLDSQELFDPVTGSWSETGPLTRPRADHSATRLLDGRVLLAGGQTTAERTGVSDAEVYQPETGLCSALKSPMAGPRFAHSALRLRSGAVLLAGGDVDDIVYGTARAELFQPEAGTFSLLASLPDLRFHHTATLMPDGSVALVGGRGSGVRAGASTNTTFDWRGEGTSWTQGPFLAHAREQHTAALLPSGRLLVAGGWSVTSPRSGTRYAQVPTWELRTADGGLWEEHPLLRARARHSSTLLPTGGVLLAGGEAPGANGTSALVVPTELLEVADDGWQAAPGPGATRGHAQSLLLLDGRVLVLGETKDGGPAELVSGAWGSARPEVLQLPDAPPQPEASATLLESGEVLVAGGLAKGAGLEDAALFLPSDASFVPLPPMPEGHARHSATLLPNGNVLVAGGVGPEGRASTACALYDPMQRAWRSLVPLTEARAGHSATLLPDGRVLLAGGVDADGAALHSVELFDPGSERWELVPLPGLLGREQHQALLAPDGSLLLVGGREGATARLEVERLSGAPLSADSAFVEVVDTLPEPRIAPATMLLLNGHVLVVGGEDLQGNPNPSALLLDGRSGRVLGPAAPPAYARAAGAAATLLPDGRVRLVGGGAPAERYDEGRGAPEALRPAIEVLPAAIPHKQPLAVRGSGLTGAGEASGGTARSSATDVPLLLLRRADGSLQALARTTSFSDRALSAQLPLLPGGPHWVYPVTNAVVGEARALQLGLPRGEACEADNACASHACSTGVCCDHACPDGSCASGTCQVGFAPTGSLFDGGIASIPGTYAPTLPPDPVPPHFASAADSLQAHCAQALAVPAAVQGDGPLTFALGGEVPEGMEVDAASGELRWSPSRAQVGHYRVVRRVSSAAGEDSEVLDVDVACDAMQLGVRCGCNGGGEAGSLATAGALLGLLRRRRRKRGPGDLSA
nr:MULTISPECIES: kelch repeat-containing protein [Myxococcaceae]